jgi:hypothetical protein
MRRLALLFAAVAILGWASPLLADTPDYQCFFVTVYENGRVRDQGFLCFFPGEYPDDPVLQSGWWGKGWWPEGGQWHNTKDYGSQGCSWEGWYDWGIDAPYDEFRGGYYKPWGDRNRAIIFGWMEPLNQEKDLFFYGEVYTWF